MINNIMVGDNLYISRCRAKLTLNELADKSNISMTTLRKYESGIIEGMRLSSLSKLCEVLNVTVAELLTTKI